MCYRISEQYEKLKKQQQQQQSTTKMDVRPLPPPRSPIHHQPPPPHYISSRMVPQSHVVMPIGYPSSNPYGEAEGISEVFNRLNGIVCQDPDHTGCFENSPHGKICKFAYFLPCGYYRGHLVHLMFQKCCICSFYLYHYRLCDVKSEKLMFIIVFWLFLSSSYISKF